MLTAESVVGKIVSFICEKTVGKLIQLSFDKRKKACRSLTKLYYCVQCLDDVTDAIFRTVEDFKGNGDAFAVVNALNNHKHEVGLATNMFVDLGHELSAGLEIVDPEGRTPPLNLTPHDTIARPNPPAHPGAREASYHLSPSRSRAGGWER